MMLYILISGESVYTLAKYGEAVRNILGLPAALPSQDKTN